MAQLRPHTARQTEINIKKKKKESGEDADATSHHVWGLGWDEGQLDVLDL